MNGSPYLIRPALPADAAGIAELLQGMGWFKAYENKTPDQNQQELQTLLRGAQTEPERSLLLVATDAQQHIHGYCAVHWLPVAVQQGWEGYVSELFVAEAARGAGLGQQLLDAATQAARDRDCVRIWLVNNRDRPSYVRGFYSQQGWSEQAEMARFVLPLRTTDNS